MKFRLAKDTRIGARRINQDAMGHWQTSGALLLAVADGLGGHARGEVAAQLAIQLIGAAFEREAKPRLADPDVFLAKAMADGHAAIMREGDRLGLHETPRTVIVACVIQDGWAYWTHVGDCRMYYFRQGRIMHRTRDHTVVQQLIDSGRIREEAAASHPERNRLIQCLGGYTVPKPEAPLRERLLKDDILVLCSDGFWGPLTQRQMMHALLSRPLGEAIPELMQLAEVRAGAQCDNVTVLAMTWDEEQVGEKTLPLEPQYGKATEVRDFTATDPDFVHMTDEEIEKAIEELKAALRKNNAPPR
jgi:serine/threonine protein phosphatase PrpC